MICDIASDGRFEVGLVKNDTVIDPVDPGVPDEKYGFSFGNRAADYGYSQGNNIPLEIWQIVFGPNIGKAKYESQKNKWYGNCFGVASTVQTLYTGGIVNGKDAGAFDPKGSATRAEVAAVLHRFAEKTR